MHTCVKRPGARSADDVSTIYVAGTLSLKQGVAREVAGLSFVDLVPPLLKQNRLAQPFPIA